MAIHYLRLLLVLVGLAACSHSRFRFKKQRHHRRQQFSSSSSSVADDTRDTQPPRSSHLKPTRHADSSTPKYRPNKPDLKVDQCSEKPFYDYNILALMWPSQFCTETKQCNDSWEANWDFTTPLLRGYWPASGEPSYYECFADDDSSGDPSCQKNGFAIDKDVLQLLGSKPEILQQLQHYWHPFPNKSDQQYYKQEWVKHGSCFLMNILEDNPRVYEVNPEAFNHTVFVEYFKNAIEKVKSLQIELKPHSQYHSKKQFAQSIGFKGKENHFNLICGDDNQVDQIHICYNRTRMPGKQSTVECPHYDNCLKYESFVIR